MNRVMTFMIHAKKREFRKAFNLHYNKYNSNSSSSSKSEKLLLFYAIECGLKYLILDIYKKSSTKDFKIILYEGKKLSDQFKGSQGHSIEKLLKILNVRSFNLPSLPTKMIDKGGKKVVANSSEYNQVWRYGIECDIEIESKIEKELLEILKYIKAEIKRKKLN